MNRLPVVLALSAMILGCAAAVNADVYSGSLAYSSPAPFDSDDELAVIGQPTQWPSYNVTMHWTVTDEDTSFPSFPWKYTYTFSHDGSQAGFSHIIIETSDGFTEDDITGLTGASVASIGLQNVSSGNPHMPENVTGIRFNPLSSGLFSMTWSFWSDRAPVWGDFYARCGGGPVGDLVNSAYNYNEDDLGVERGFLDPNDDNSLLDDVDPVAMPSNGSVDFHILRPDSVVPEPSTPVLLLMGVGLLLRRSRGIIVVVGRSGT